MTINEVLKWMEQMSEEESEIILEAAIKRRKTLLNGGEVIYAEYSRKRIEKLEKVLHQADKMLQKERGSEERMKTEEQDT